MRPLKVLLVDDEEELVTTLVERLNLRDIEADGVLNAADALNKVKEKEYDVVVIDVKMPEIDGLEAMRRIMEIRPNTKVLLLTGRGSMEESRICREEGAYAYLIKPVNIDDLITKMKEAVNGDPD